MREIEFKAKRVDDGVWVYGYFFKSWDNCYILHGTVNGVPVMVEVIPETVCQFTGILDKQGVKIFEGDIIEFVTFFNKDTVVEHVWIDEHACLHPFFDPFYIDDEQGAGLVDETIKVLGNIHDKARQKQALINMMRGDEELGLYD